MAGVLAGAVTVATLAGCGGGATAAKQDPVERGKYLVTTTGCNDCHTPWKVGPNGPEPDMTRMMSGHPQDLVITSAPAVEAPWMAVGSASMTAWAGPWGVSFAANLTPDDETGIGAWDEQVFAMALRNGKMMGAGRPVLPPMPWQWYAKMTDEDLGAMYAYLKTIPPIVNHVPDAILANQAPPAAPPPAD